jgi:integrase
MARQRGSKFQADVNINGVRQRRTFETLAEAEAYERKIAKGLPTDSPSTFKKFREAHFDFIWGDVKAPQAVQWTFTALDNFIPAEKPLEEFTTAYILGLVAEMKKTSVSNATINRRLSSLSKLLRHAEKLELARRPVIEFLKEAEGRDRVLTDAEERKMGLFFDHMGLTVAGALTQFLLYTGCRLGEAYTLTRDRVDNKRATFHHTLTKTSKTRVVPLVSKAEEAWKVVCRQSNLDAPFSVLSRNTFRGHWNRLREHMGELDDEGFVPHMLRHTCCSRLVSGGIPLPQVMLWMGHRNIATTMRYSHLAPKDLDMAAKVLEGVA